MDFSTNWKHSPPWPEHYTVAAASGFGTIRTPYPGNDPCWFEIYHGDGWKTSYYHLRNIDQPGDQGFLNRNDRVGSIGVEVCNGGFASGAHVHFSLWYNGSYYDLDGIQFSGWTVTSGPEPYSSGFLERDGIILEPYDSITNDYHTYYGLGIDYALRFHGNRQSDVDRVKIQIDDPENNLPGPPADVGFHDFVMEWWMKAEPGANTAASVECGANEQWKLGNILIDRSRSSEGSEYGVSLAGGRIVFGVTGAGTGSLTLCSTSALDDGEWHHIAVQRNRWEGTTYLDGQLWLFIDGVLEASAVGPGGDLSYPDDALPGNLCGPSGTDPCTDTDPYLVIGASKWETGEGFQGWIDDLRISWWLRYFENFTPSPDPHPQDSQTVALYRFNEGSGDVVYDTGGFDGGTSNGIRLYGGDPPGPEWGTSSLFTLSHFLPFISR
jgi:hypothetical protein